MDTNTEAATTAPGWATAAGLVALTPPRSPGGEHGGPALDRLLIAERIARYGWAYDERDQAPADRFTVLGELGDDTVEGLGRMDVGPVREVHGRAVGWAG
jgi:hypothetical protein